MNDDNTFQGRIITAYLDSSPASLKAIAQETGLTLKECEQQWNRFVGVGTAYRGLPEHELSQIAVNRVVAYAREEAARRPAGRFSFLTSFFRPGYALASLATLFTVTVMGMQARYAASPVMMTAQRTQVLAPAMGFSPTASLDADIPKVSTPLDFARSLPDFAAPQRRYQMSGPGSLATPVSFGETSRSLAIEDPLDTKIRARAFLSEKDLDGLFYRARKSERQTYYNDALKDYQLIANFYPGYPNIKAVRLAIANCLAALDHKEQAITTLEKFEDAYGGSEDIDQWIDELKSESF